MALENVETAEDAAVADRLLAERNRVVLSQSVKEAMKESAAKVSISGSVGDEDEDAAVSLAGEEVFKGKGGKKAAVASALHAKGKGKRTATLTPSKVILTIEKAKARQAAMLIPDLDEDDKVDAFVKREFDLLLLHLITKRLWEQNVQPRLDTLVQSPFSILPHCLQPSQASCWPELLQTH
jgi:hypothetical protein